MDLGLFPPQGIGATLLDISSYRRTGNYYTTPVAGTQDNLTTVATKLGASPFVVTRTISIDRIAIEVTTLALATVVRLGIYNDDGSVFPGSLLLDAGTVDTSTAGLKTITISQTLSPGLYWLAAATGATSPELRAVTTNVSVIFGFNADGTGDLQQDQRSWYKFGTDYTGGLPDPFSADAIAGIANPVIAVRIE